jgi:hypothetical protein
MCCGTYNEHKFEPRYDEEDKIDHQALDKGIKLLIENGGISFKLDEKTKSKTYLFDICIKCGTKIVR